MLEDSIIFSIFLIFTGAAVLAALALFARQSLLVAYILLGGLVGPWGFQLVNDPDIIREIGNIGIMFLLFLLGLNLQPAQLVRMLREAIVVTVVSSLVFGAVGFGISQAFGFSLHESVVIGSVMMFSSTIIGLKLLPTTALHHRHVGQVMISILLLQDILAIGILLVLEGFSQSGMEWKQVASLAVSLPALVIFSLLFERYVLQRLIKRFDTIQEYIFLTAIGWCLGVAQLAELLGLSHEIGAFIAGVALATNPIALFIAESFKPLRDFFLIMFFFSLGAGFNINILPEVILPASIIALLMLACKPVVFSWLLKKSGEVGGLPNEVGVRLGQVSEFSLMIAVLALNTGAIGAKASYLIQTTTLITFIVSSYLIMLSYPTPIAVSDRLRKD
ncbi:MAG: cation:proton antiporter [Gammaproteobacteria bacterium]|nr:cation:proton antiporter [Gammaproteobacteria bacterium]MDH3985942.1 cation:proton antiporter [Gammaproteobacteria bacterium]